MGEYNNLSSYQLTMITSDEKARYQKDYETWIKANSDKIVNQPNPNVFSDSVYTHPNHVTMSIRQLNDQTDRIIFGANLNFPADALEVISALPSTEQIGLGDKAVLMLTQMGVQFNFQVQNNILQSITVERTVFGESMTKQIFFDNLYRIIDALSALQTKFHQKLGTGRVTSGGSSTHSSFYG